jgi:cbb3-type cytochrome oxidase maturation protein
MLVSLYFLVFLSVGLGVIFALGFVYAAKTNQFKDIEEPKYQMLRDQD